MKACLFSPRRASLAVVTAAFVALPAQATASSAAPAVDTSMCSNPLLSQPFLSAGDSSWYMLLPGEGQGGFAGSDWTLTGGASIATTTLPGERTGSVLNLPSGAKAVSPTVCVQSGFRTARTMVRDVAGAEGVQFYVSYAGTNTWNDPQNTGQVHGHQTSWTLSDPVNVQPSDQPGWQLVRFTFIAGGKTSDFQIYDFYVDPRMI
jgi:hypothetical protein